MPIRMTIIGAGPGGYVAAIRAAQLGAEVTVIEQDNVGGTCLNWGCIPSKIMTRAAQVSELFGKAHQWGINVRVDRGPDLQVLMERKRQVIQGQIEGIMKLFQHHRIRYLKGNGYLKSPRLMTVAMEGGKTTEVPWDRLLLAMGSQSLGLPAFPFDGKKILSSNDALYVQEVPESLLIAGGGVIGCEFAFIFAALGSRVIVVEALSRIIPMPSVDPDCSKVVQREMKKRKITFMPNRSVEKFEEIGDKLRVAIGPSPFGDQPGSKDVKSMTLDVEKVLTCVGRRPNTARAGLENLGVNTDKRGWIMVNDRMETNIPHVYAIGDVLGPSRVMLAHVASAEGRIAAENAMGGTRLMNYTAIPNVIFTLPEVASVGLTEDQARQAGYDVRADIVLFRTLGKAQVTGEIAGQVKLIWDAKDGKILGVHIVGPHASDLIAECTLAVQRGVTVKELAETIHAHPTFAEVMAEASFKALGMPIHG